MRLTILTPERRLLGHEEVTEVTLPGVEGQIQILDGHANFLSRLDTGAFSYITVGGQSVSGAISTGFVEVAAQEVRVMAETLELASEIDLSRAKRAQEKAQKVLEEASLDETKFKKYELKLERAMIRQQVAG